MALNNSFPHRFITIILVVLSCGAVFVLGNDFRERMAFYRAMENISAAVTSEEKQTSDGDDVIILADIARYPERYVVVDIREEEEFAQGHVKGALHRRLGDVLSDRAMQEEILSRGAEKTLVFFCHDGERSRIAADFFEKNYGIVTLVVRDGFKELRRSDELADTLWDGTLRYVLPYDFWKDLRARDYKLDRIDERGMIIDVSDASHGENMLHAPIMRMSSAAVENVLKIIGRQSFSVVCDARVSCFYAKLLGYRAEKRGAKFEGYDVRTENE